MGEGDTAAEREALLHKNTSILDMVSERAKSLSNDLGPGDKARLSDYLDTVREIERRVTMAGSRDLKGIKVPDAPVGELEDFDKQVRLMFDLIALAYQADLTRVSTMMLGREGSVRAYPEIGVPDPHHPLTHHRGHPVRLGIRLFARIGRGQRHNHARKKEHGCGTATDVTTNFSFRLHSIFIVAN